MKAAYIEDYCDAGGIRYGDLPDPVPAAGEVIVRPDAVAVNKVDTFVRSGAWRTPVRFPLVVGRDLAGTVAAAGPGVTGLREGDRVWTNSAGYGGRPGATAELVAVPASRLYRLPPGADPVAFVAAVHPGATAHGVLTGRARVRAGETVAVVGGNGAVGMCLIQVAAAAGARAVAVVRDRAAAGRLRELGAWQVVACGDTGQAVAAASDAAPRGIDVVVDTTGKAGLSEAAGLLNPRGRIVLIARGEAALTVSPWQFYTRELQLLGFIVSGLTVPELAAAAAWINDRHAAGPLTVGPALVMGFADAARAHALIEDGQLPRSADRIVGRLILRP